MERCAYVMNSLVEIAYENKESARRIDSAERNSSKWKFNAFQIVSRIRLFRTTALTFKKHFSYKKNSKNKRESDNFITEIFLEHTF